MREGWGARRAGLRLCEALRSTGHSLDLASGTLCYLMSHGDLCVFLFVYGVIETRQGRLC